jgi:hypothetical protein
MLRRVHGANTVIQQSETVRSSYLHLVRQHLKTGRAKAQAQETS